MVIRSLEQAIACWFAVHARFCSHLNQIMIFALATQTNKLLLLFFKQMKKVYCNY